MEKSSIKVYEPGSPFRNPSQFHTEILEGFHAARELAWQLTKRDFKVQFRQSMAGYIWAFVPPVLGAFTFIVLRNSGAVQFSNSGVPYAAYALVGMMLWQVFVDSMMNPLKTMQSCRQMLTKINFPREALILSPIQLSAIGLGIRITILIPVMVWFQIPLTWGVLWAVGGMLSLILLGTCFGLLMAPVGALYRDVQMGIIALTTFWMFMTPVVFNNVQEGVAGMIMGWNPVTHVLSATRDWLFGILDSPFASGFLVVTGFSISTLVFAAIIFRVLLGRVVERMGT